MRYIKSINKFLSENYTEDYNFNLGECGLYAIALNRLYNYPMFAIRGKFLEEDWGGEREYDYEYSHIMVKLPNGNFLDSSGEQTQQQMIDLSVFTEDIKDIEVVEVTEDEIAEIFMGMDYESGSDEWEDEISKVVEYIKNKL